MTVMRRKSVMGNITFEKEKWKEEKGRKEREEGQEDGAGEATIASRWQSARSTRYRPPER